MYSSSTNIRAGCGCHTPAHARAVAEPLAARARPVPRVQSSSYHPREIEPVVLAGSPGSKCRPFLKLEKDPDKFAACNALADEIGSITDPKNAFKLIEAAIGNEVNEVFGLVTLDDISFSENQVDVLNAENILATTALFGLTIRSLNNRFKEPLHLQHFPFFPGTDIRLRRQSLIHFAPLGAVMIGNQGHLCFLQLTGGSSTSAFANQSLGNAECETGDTTTVIPEVYNSALESLIRITAAFAMGLSN